MSNFKVGIDLGTTNTACCTIEDGKFKFLKFKGKEFVKSALLYKDGKLTIGEKARKKSVIYPENYISSAKTFMGDNDKIWEIEDRKFTSTDVAIEILKDVKSRIKSSWNVSKSIEAVITVPAYFDHQQKKETRKAGEDAGFIVKQIITEPISAAMAYGFEDEINQRLLIVDIGGGTFDVSVLDVKDGKDFDSKAVDGDRKLGGDDFDDIIYEMFLTNIRKEYGVNLKTLEKSGLQHEEYAKVIQKLKIESEEKKVELSKSDTVEVDIPNLFVSNGESFNFSLKITKEEFEKKSNLLLKKIKKVILRALEDNNIENNSIDKIVLVGGSSYIPAIQEIIKDIFNKKPYSDKPLDKLVAMGASLKADDEDNTITLKEQNSHSIGIEVKGNKYEEVLAKGSYYSKISKKMFTTIIDNQKEVEINVFGRDEDNPDKCNDKYFFGGFTLDNIQKARAGAPDIEVEFGFDKSGILTVKAKDLNSGAENSKVIITQTQERKKIEVPRLDIYFTIDTTGSMNPYIDGVMNTCEKFADIISEKGIDFRLGLIGFGDETYYEETTVYKLTKDINIFKDNVKYCPHTGGGDEPETQFEAIESTVKALGSSGNQKIMILITDASAHSPETTGKGRLRYLDVKNMLIQHDIKTYVVGPDYHYYKEFSNSTGGAFFKISNYDKFVSILNEIAVNISGLQAK